MDPENDLVHFVINAVETMNLSEVSVNSRGSGSKQYPPRMMLALVIYSYAVQRESEGTDAYWLNQAQY